MKMILDGTPEEIAELLKRIKAEPEGEKAAPLQTSIERILRETGTPWDMGRVTCGCDEGTARCTTDSGRTTARNG